MAGTRLVVIGGDAAGMSAASQARRRRTPDDMEIVAFERGPHTSYSACGLPYLASKVVEDWRSLVARWPREHAERGIDARTGHEVEEIDLANRRVRVRDLDQGTTSDEAWDVLLIATGAAPIRPPIPGIDLPGVLGLSTLQDGMDLRAAIDAGPASAVVIGGGYIGIEAAEALVRRGVRTTLVERGSQVMGNIDPEMGARVGDAVRKLGIQLLLDEPVEAVEGDGSGVKAVRTAARTIAADLVVLGLGTRPRAELAEAAGIPIGSTGAIVVNERQQTPIEGVWAAGDCVEVRHLVSNRPVNFHLGTIANKQGRIAGINIGGGYATFPGVLGTAITRVCEIEVARTGLTAGDLAPLGLEHESETTESTTRAGYMPDAGSVAVKILAERRSGRLLGAQIVGEEGAAKRIDVLAAALWNQMDIHDMVNLDLSYAPPFSPVWDPVLIAVRRLAEKIDRKLGDCW
jgi:NADPH-dependent 2,4-dienoyl-CoA reductase/sulfur reductase-like enzyme